MSTRESNQAQRDARRETAPRRPTERESSSEATLRTYLGAAMYSTLRRRDTTRDAEKDANGRPGD